jgi:WD40 repeat protein
MWKKVRRLMVLIVYAASFLGLMRGAAGVEAQEKLAQIVVNRAMYDVEWSPNGERMAIAFENGIGIYTDSLQEIAQLATGGVVRQVSWSADSNWLASIGRNDPTARIWRWDGTINTFVLDRTITNSHGYSYVTGASWSLDGNWLAILAQNQPQGAANLVGIIEIWDTQSWTLQNNLLNEHVSSAPVLVWNSGSSQIAGAANICPADEVSSCDLPYFYTADTISGELTYKSSIFIPHIYALAWSGNNKLAVSSPEEILIFDATINQTTSIFPNRSPIGGGALEVDWSSNGNYLVTTYYDDGLVEIIDIQTGTTLLQFSTGGLNGMDLSPDDRKLAMINSTDGVIEIWNVPTLPDLSGTPTVTPVPTLTPSRTPTPIFTHTPTPS